jgi:oligopeptide/dipeptide ABC transporter ATP-binding protein
MTEAADIHAVEPASSRDATSSLVSVEDLEVHFTPRRGLSRQAGALLRAVDGVTFSIARGETLGLVGESGCGKTTTGRATILLVSPTSGSVRFKGIELTTLSYREKQRARRDMQMIFQDPYSSLDPRMRVGKAIAEPLRIHGLARGREATRITEEVLAAVGLSKDALDRFPHEFSGGQRQRVAIARALAVRPALVVCDEPISSLDVSIQAQVLNLFVDLQEQFDLTYLFIAHDLSAIQHISRRIAVMYLGKIVEVVASTDLYGQPLHPYTKSLLSAVPRPNPHIERNRERIVLQGDVPSPMQPPSGCRFHTRCPFAQDRCRVEEPQLATALTNHLVACHYWEELANVSPARGLKRA